MSGDLVDCTDGALILDGLAQILELVPGLASGAEQRERVEVVSACRAAAKVVHATAGSEQSFEAAAAYGGGEWMRSLLRALVGREGAEQLLTQGR